ncbi:TPA: polyribonucleotide nucleotidyltransferase [Candidatus Delongbacteria bacterium]|nr:MAG: polyribonucleotide nucleotidyltransferase [Candidatus Delongbacteria bacterium GWF2_40_14]HAQ62628.1 polyribonucleotide nucleotidyltransferase [Candidatus Delongbacteria bacterium]
MFFSKKMMLGGKELVLESGKMARQANGAAVVKYGDNMLLVTICAQKTPAVGFDFFPMTVEYKEKMYAAGKFPGGFIKRESRPSNNEILSARIIDRPIRPLFPEGFNNEVQIMCSVLSSDGEIVMDVFGIIGTSLAVNLSDIPFSQPVAAVRVGRLNGEFIANPTIKQMKECDIELVISGGKGFISMVEGESKEVSEDELLSAVQFGQKIIDDICDFQAEIVKEFGKPKFTYTVPEISQALIDKVTSLSESKTHEFTKIKIKEDRNEARRLLHADVVDALEEEYPEDEKHFTTVMHDLEKDIVRKNIIKNNIRIDGRKPDQIRQITCELDILPRVHGSALFTRGETQSLGVCTLGGDSDTQTIENIYENEEQKFYLHYNFPPFSVGEVKRITGVSRREIGHGNLAERSFKPVIPHEADFPYTIRLVSEILESNGSSSMASVCSNSLAMMAAGVPVKKQVAGIAMGLIKEGDDVVILSDILGDEDHLGDMDFKVTGTEDGICAYQMDIKIQGISIEIMKKALEQAKQGRKHILGIMNATIAAPRAALSEHAPRILNYKIAVDEIGMFVGPGGKNIKGIIAEYGVKIDVDDNGYIKILSDGENGEAALKHIQSMFAKPEIGAIYDGVVRGVKPFGVFVEIMPRIEGLVHVSELSLERIANVEEHFKMGDKLQVKYIGTDKEGRIKLVRKELLKPEVK